MENIRYSIEKNKKFILVLLFCILFSSIVMILFFDNSSSNNSETVFKSIVNELNKSNSSLNNCIKDTTIDANITIETMQQNISTLENFNSTLSATVITNDNDRLLVSKILLAIDSTTNLYNYCIDSLTTSNKPTFIDSMAKLTEYKNNCTQYYQDISDFGIDIKFSNSNLQFFDNFLNYLSTLEKLNKTQQVKDLQTKEFFKTFNAAITNFSNLLQDLQPAINKIREDNRSLDVLIDDLSEKEIDFLMIKRNLSYVSIPENCLAYYNSLNDTFNIYSTYLATMKTALVYEKSSTNYHSNKKNIDKNYSNAYSKYLDVKNSLDSLNNSLENL